MRKHIKGSVATYCEFKEGTMVTSTRPLRVIKNYVGWEQNPKHWSNIRAAELSAAMTWILANLPPEIIAKQTHIENREN